MTEILMRKINTGSSVHGSTDVEKHQYDEAAG